MRKFFVLCFLFFGCSYAPHYSLVKDSYNTYAPTYSSAPVYAPQTTTQTTPAPAVKKKLPKKTKLTIIPYGGVR